ncbi:hypothetical protein WJX81_005497 [Elliptochloris bilobata]|uniref:Non-specific serine/threonine protein kinase n=1 Tax=Elliptochloris bilobata TaxID=381761 RepID=A0AAW1S0T2_9CHLO
MAQLLLPPIAESLLIQFWSLSKTRVEAATPNDRGEVPVEPLASALYDRVLDGLHLVARHAATGLLDALLQWRKENLNLAARSGAEPVILRKRLAVETVFLEASVRLVDGDSSGLSERQADALERLAFDWILNAEKYVEPKFAELVRAREKVARLCGVLLGSLSVTRLTPISARFFQELEARLRVDATPARQELLQLCEGMRWLRLPVSTNAEVAAATDFLVRMHPLRHVAPVRKSQVQHALCEALAAVLASAVRQDLPWSVSGDLEPAVAAAWFAAVAAVRAEIGLWTARQSKHAAVGYPLLTALVCLEDDAGFAAHSDALVDALHRQLRDKLLRTAVLGCLVSMVRTHLLRHAGAAPQGQTDAWLARATRPVLAQLRKANLQFAEQQDAVVELCTTVAAREPNFGVGMVAELLAGEPTAWDAVGVGLRALRGVLLAAPARAGKPGGHEPKAALLEMVRRGEAPLGALGVAALAPRLGHALARVLQACAGLFGAYRITSPPRVLAELLPKERAAGLPVLAAALECVPFLLPEHWDGAHLAAELPGYTVHADATVRAAAAEALLRCMRALPELRNELLLAATDLLARLPDDLPDALRDALVLVSSLAHEWDALLEEDARAGRHEARPATLRLDLASLQGAAAAFLCAAEPDVRRAALGLLAELRSLHTSLAAAADGEGLSTEPGAYLMNVFEEAGRDIVRRCYWDFGRWSDTWRAWRTPADDAAPGPSLDMQDLMLRSGGAHDAVRWTRCVAEALKLAALLCPGAVQATYANITIRIQALAARDVTGRTVLAELPGDARRLDLARAYSAAACACAAPASGAAGGLPPRELFRVLLSTIRAGPETLAALAVAALGGCHADHLEALAEELTPLSQEFSGERAKSARGRTRREDVRLAAAQVSRLAAEGLPPGALRTSAALRAHFLVFLDDTRGLLASGAHENFLEVAVLRYCLCVVARVVAQELPGDGPSALSLQRRRELFDLTSTWAEEGTAGGRPRGEVARAVAAARMRAKDAEATRATEAEITEAAEYVATAALAATAALLHGPSLDADAKRSSRRAYAWIDRLLQSEPAAGAWRPARGASRDATACAALHNLLSSNPDALAVCLDQCYAASAPVARAYFQVLAEVYASRVELAVPAHVLVSLVLYKVVDENAEVREDALQLLSVLDARIWSGSAAQAPHADGAKAAELPVGEEPAIVVGGIRDTYRHLQLQLSDKLAREHPELSEALCVEVMLRQLDSASAQALRHQVLTCLAPWMRNLTFAPRWEGSWSEQLLRYLWYVTWQHVEALPAEVEALWTTAAANTRNIVPVLDYLISKCTHGEDDLLVQYLEVSKRISVYLARTSAQQTVDHLAYEIAQMLHAPGDPPPRAPPGDELYEFRHERAPAVRRGSQPVAALPDRPHHARSASNPSTASHFRRMGEMLKSAASARSELSASSSFTSSHNDLAGRAPSPGRSPPSRRHSASRLPAAVGRGALGRPEVALCLLAEVAYEHDEPFRAHLPLLLHAMLVALDAREPLVAGHARAVVSHLLHALAARHVAPVTPGAPLTGAAAQVARTLRALQAGRGRRLWAPEDASLADPRPPSAAALGALVLAALRPHASAETCAALVAALAACAASGTSAALDHAAEVMLTLQAMVEGMPPGRLVLFPQLVLASLAVLCTPYVLLFRLSLGLASKVLARIDLTDSAAQDVLLACAAPAAPTEPRSGSPARRRNVAGGQEVGSWPLGAELLGAPSLLAVQQLLVRGLFKPETELLTVEVMAQVARQLACAGERPHSTLVAAWAAPGGGGAAALAEVLGDMHAQLALSLAALLPWLALHFRHSAHTPLAALCILAHARACSAVGLPELATALCLLNAEATDALSDLLEAICTPFCRAFFPRYGLCALQRWMDVLARGGPESQAPALLLLRAAFRAPGLDLGAAAAAAPPALFAPAAALLGGGLGGEGF